MVSTEVVLASRVVDSGAYKTVSADFDVNSATVYAESTGEGATIEIKFNYEKLGLWDTEQNEYVEIEATELMPDDFKMDDWKDAGLNLIVPTTSHYEQTFMLDSCWTTTDEKVTEY
jgi:hypothetical protein